MTRPLAEQFADLPEDTQWRLFSVLDAVISTTQDEKLQMSHDLQRALEGLQFVAAVRNAEPGPSVRLLRALEFLISHAHARAETPTEGDV